MTNDRESWPLGLTRLIKEREEQRTKLERETFWLVLLLWALVISYGMCGGSS